MNALLLVGLLVTMNALAQQENGVIKITGTVKDELKTAMPGVTIVNLSTKTGTTTKENGSFEINAKRGDSLSARMIGYDAFNFVISNIINFEITLVATNNSLNEVVVVGFGEQKKISLVGAQSSVSVEDIKTPVANLSAALAGRIAGLVGVQRSGLPGSNSADVWIRGISTFNGSGNSASPLIVVDGVQGRDINAFDPEDISSFTILKDAAATAVYGVAGANGVILITTKKGVSGKPNLMFNYNQGLTAFTKRPDLMDGVSYMLLRNEAQRNSGMTPEYSNNYINGTIKQEDPYLYPDVDWMEEMFNKTAMNRRANFAARGGSDFATYYTSLAYYEEESLLKTDNLQAYDASTKFRRYNFTSNVSMDWTKTTKFELGVQGYVTQTNMPGISPEEAFDNVMQTNPVLYPTMYPGGYLPGVSSHGAQPNPYGQLTQSGYRNLFGNQLYTNARITQDLKAWLPGLSASAMYSFDGYNGHQIDRTRSRSTYLLNRIVPYLDDGTMNLNLIYSGNDDLGYGRVNSGRRANYFEGGFNYQRAWDDHNVTGMILFNQRERVEAFASSATNSLPYRNRGVAARGTYSYQDKYFAEVNFGYNGSENFIPGRKYGFFPALGVGWVVSNEKFFEPLKDVVSFLKVRYSDGYVGDGSGGNRRFGFLTIVSTGADGFYFGSGTNQVGFQNGTNIDSYGTDVTWAKSHKQDLGLEFNLFRDKLTVVTDIFKERREGVFLQRGSLPSYIGLNSAPWGNLGIIENKGIDGTVTLNPVEIGKDLFIDFRGTFSFNRDKVIENDMAKQPEPYMERRGKNYLSTYGYVAEKLFESQEEIDKSPSQADLGNTLPGDIKYKDLNGDGVINANDITRIGNGDVPTTVYGFGLNLTWKQFYVGAFFQGVAGADRLLNGDGIIPFNNSTGAERSNLFWQAEDRWTVENPNPHAFYPRLGYGSAANKMNSYTSSWWVKDIDFIRLKTVDLGYNLPKNAAKALRMKNARIYFQGVNLFYWSKFKLWDPELNTGNGTAYPNIRTFSVGVQANF
ncbi:TonB-dependent receptor [Chitinophaga horti]|uniref:TonB-dependent receptor n=1 Tax=Chitinophaga horti TaxID=2920382 RepID=A0ABY6IZY6_9BACT|nr:TonB-dependent receptor [Chitinophaga horti]UYQ91957.1 TonB-dependent receptor [Chitinophaga horti]